ncbi:DUF2188 domain-containing protein [Tianweitania sp.]|uniref:DUF2188 domain-containing protein n=1 Tax=Tianweitania sp. TaxID=2021634 RepID=UPI00289F7CC7|nr:DUF2188 domain-containing protein [Tianweitania sp.]
MRKLILAALGYAAYRWLSAPSSQSSDRQAERNPSPDNRSDASLSARERRREKRQRARDEENDDSASSSSANRPARAFNSNQTPEDQGETGEVTYRIVEHDEGWAYKVGDVFSETFPTHDAAKEAAEAAARAQEQAGEPEPIEYQDEDGKWRQEESDGRDRPHTDVEDGEPRKG